MRLNKTGPNILLLLKYPGRVGKRSNAEKTPRTTTAIHVLAALATIINRRGASGEFIMSSGCVPRAFNGESPTAQGRQ